MPPVYLTKRIEFAAAHRYMRPEWDDAKNRAAFGLCYNAPAHGHNYLLEVTVAGEVDQHTGMVINLFDLKRVLLAIIEEFDHRNLNLDMPYFKDLIPTSENLAKVLWTKLESQQDIGTLHAIRLFEDEDLYTDVTSTVRSNVASVTKRYSFPAAPLNRVVPPWDCFITIQGRIDPMTGMVADIRVLDRAVHASVAELFEREHLDQLLKTDAMAWANVAKTIWERLAGSLSGNPMEKVRLVCDRDLVFEYSG